VDASATIRLPTLPGNNDKEASPVLMPATADSATEASDEVLMAQLGRGNREALAILFRRYARSVRAIAYRSVRDAAEAGFQGVFAKLSLNQRETLRLHFIEDYSFAEIAARLGQSRGNIKHHYFRGLEKLRKQLFAGKLQGDGTVL
jgi:DNA-directed RNA polymerase specialized sigma24 family protein